MSDGGLNKSVLHDHTLSNWRTSLSAENAIIGGSIFADIGREMAGDEAREVGEESCAIAVVEFTEISSSSTRTSVFTTRRPEGTAVGPLFGLRKIGLGGLPGRDWMLDTGALGVEGSSSGAGRDAGRMRAALFARGARICGRMESEFM